MTEFTLYGSVPSKKNSRVNTKTGRSFPSPAYCQWLPDARLTTKLAHKGEPFEGMVKMEIEMHGQANDVDNLASSLLDMMEGIVYINDRQVISLLVEKHKARRKDKRCVVRVWEVPGE